jgi:hypothetical protein
LLTPFVFFSLLRAVSFSERRRLLSILLFSLLPAKDDAALLQSQKDEEWETGRHSLPACFFPDPPLSVLHRRPIKKKQQKSSRQQGWLAGWCGLGPAPAFCVGFDYLRVSARAELKFSIVSYTPCFSSIRHPYINLSPVTCSFSITRIEFPPFSVGQGA